MSLFSRALGAAGGAVATIGQKYLDEQLYQQRAQAMAELQRGVDETRRQDALDFETRNADKKRELEAGHIRSKADAERAVKTAELTDPTYQGARIASENAFIRGTTPAKVEQATAIDNAKSYELSPGQQRFRGGTVQAENTRPTSQEVQRDLYEKELKGLGGKLPKQVEVELGSLREQIKGIDAEINKNIASGTMAPPDGKNPESGDPSYKHLLEKKRVLERRFNDILREQGGAAAQPDPLGLRKPSPASPSAAPGSAGGEQVSPEQQQQRDVEAGRLMISSEYGGDVNRAREGLRKIETEAGRATGEARAMLASEASRLRLGIEALAGQRPAAPQGAEPPQPSIGERIRNAMARDPIQPGDVLAKVRAGAALTPQEDEFARRAGWKR